jgi:hypothetical protein
MKEDMGNLKGRVDGLEATCGEIKHDVKEILKSISTIPDMQAKLDAHLKEDEPAERFVDRNLASIVKHGVWVAITGFIAWFVTKVTGG